MKPAGKGLMLAMAAAGLLGTAALGRGGSPFMDDGGWPTDHARTNRRKPKPVPKGPTAKRAKVKAARKANVRRTK